LAEEEKIFRRTLQAGPDDFHSMGVSTPEFCSIQKRNISRFTESRGKQANFTHIRKP
jgi:hypothetical protein